MQKNEHLLRLQKGVMMALGWDAKRVIPAFFPDRPEDKEPFAVINTINWESRGVPSVVTVRRGNAKVEKQVITPFRVTFTVDFIFGDPTDALFQLRAWLRTEAAQKLFAELNMTFISTGATIDLTALEAHQFTPRLQTELLFEIVVQAAAHEVPTATQVDIGGDKEFTVQL